MVILESQASDSPNIWYAAMLWCPDGMFVDYMRFAERLFRKHYTFSKHYHN